MAWTLVESSNLRATRDFVVLQVGRVIQVAFSSFAFLIAARLLGVEGFGLYSTILATLNATIALADLGLGQLAVRSVAQHNVAEISGAMAARTLVYAVAASLTVLCTTAAYVLTRGDTLACGAAALFGISYLVLQARSNVERGFWLGLLAFRRAVTIDVLVSAARFVAIAATASLVTVTVFRIAVASAISGGIALAVLERFLRYQPDQESEHRASVIPIALPFALTSLAWNFLTEWPKLGLAAVSGPAAVGNLGAAFRVLTLVLIPLQTGLNVLTPRIFAAAGTHDRRALWRGLAVLAAFSLMLMALTLIGSALVPLLLGANYRPSVPILRILAITLPFQAVASVMGDWLGGIGKQPTRLVITVIGLAVGIPIMTVAAHARGGSGIAEGYLLTIAGVAVATAVLASRSRKST